jgi:hypothetical protein
MLSDTQDSATLTTASTTLTPPSTRRADHGRRGRGRCQCRRICGPAAGGPDDFGHGLPLGIVEMPPGGEPPTKFL